MSLLVASEWSLDVDRGPEWVFIRLHGPPNGNAEGSELAEMIWHSMQQQFAKRVVLELDELPLMRSAFIGELVLLHKRIVSNGGTLRVAGLSDFNQEVLCMCRLNSRFPQYHNRADAVMGQRK